MLATILKRFHSPPLLVLVIASIGSAIVLKAFTDWPSWVYPLVALTGLTLAFWFACVEEARFADEIQSRTGTNRRST